MAVGKFGSGSAIIDMIEANGGSIGGGGFDSRPMTVSSSHKPSVSDDLKTGLMTELMKMVPMAPSFLSTIGASSAIATSTPLADTSGTFDALRYSADAVTTATGVTVTGMKVPTTWLNPDAVGSEVEKMTYSDAHSRRLDAIRATQELAKRAGNNDLLPVSVQRNPSMHGINATEALIECIHLTHFRRAEYGFSNATGYRYAIEALVGRNWTDEALQEYLAHLAIIERDGLQAVLDGIDSATGLQEARRRTEREQAEAEERLIRKHKAEAARRALEVSDAPDAVPEAIFDDLDREIASGVGTW